MHLKSKTYWVKIVDSNPNVKTRNFAMKLLDAIFNRQKGVASPRQYEVLKRIERGDTSPYNTKN